MAPLKKIGVLAMSLTWLIAQICWAQEIEEHPSVLEGAEVTLTCSWKFNKTSVVYWTIFMHETSQLVSVCPDKDRACRKKFNKYLATFNEPFSSSLTIKNISADDQHVTYQCLVTEDETGHLLYEKKFTVSKVFFIADDLNCKAIPIKDDTINVSCSVSKIYPGIVCELFQFYKNYTLVSAENLTYNVSPVAKQRYSAAMCSTIITVNEPGNYTYYANIYPGRDTRDRFRNGLKSRTLNEISFVPTVTIEQDTKGLCDEKLRFVCNGYFWYNHSKIQIQWSVQNEEIIQSDVAYGHKFISTIELKNLKSNNVNQVTCQIANARPETTFRASLDNIIKPPSQPMFFYNGSSLKNGNSEIEIKEREITSSFACTVKGGNPRVSSVRVECKIGDPLTVLTYENKSGDVVTFNITYNETTKYGFCECSAQHKSHCISSANFTFQKGPVTARSRNPMDYIYVYCYFVAGTIGAVIIAVALIIFIYFRNQWNKIYEYLYAYYFQGLAKDPGTSQQSEITEDLLSLSSSANLDIVSGVLEHEYNGHIEPNNSQRISLSISQTHESYANLNLYSENDHLLKCCNGSLCFKNCGDEMHSVYSKYQNHPLWNQAIYNNDDNMGTREPSESRLSVTSLYNKQSVSSFEKLSFSSYKKDLPKPCRFITGERPCLLPLKPVSKSSSTSSDDTFQEESADSQSSEDICEKQSTWSHTFGNSLGKLGTNRHKSLATFEPEKSHSTTCNMPLLTNNSCVPDEKVNTMYRPLIGKTYVNTANAAFCKCNRISLKETDCLKGSYLAAADCYRKVPNSCKSAEVQTTYMNDFPDSASNENDKIGCSRCRSSSRRQSLYYSNDSSIEQIPCECEYYAMISVPVTANDGDDQLSSFSSSVEAIYETVNEIHVPNQYLNTRPETTIYCYHSARNAQTNIESTWPYDVDYPQ